MSAACLDCGCGLVGRHIWVTLSATRRSELRAQGLRARSGRGLCSACYQRRALSDTLLDIERPTMSRLDLLDEWQHFTKDRSTHTQNVKAFAAYLGRNYKAVEKALSRAGVRADDWYDGGAA